MPKKTNKLNKKTETSKKVKTFKNTKKVTKKQIKKSAGNSKKNKAALNPLAGKAAENLNDLNQAENTAALSAAGGQRQAAETGQNPTRNIGQGQNSAQTHQETAQTPQNSAQPDNKTDNTADNKAEGAADKTAGSAEDNKAEKEEQTSAHGNKKSDIEIHLSDLLKDFEASKIEWHKCPPDLKTPQTPTPFDKDTYLDEMINIGSVRGIRREEQVKSLKQWRKKAEEHAAQIPFEQYMAQFNLSLAEWIIFCTVAYNTLAGRNYSSDKEHFIEVLLSSGIIHASEIRTIFSKEAALFKNKLLVKEMGSYILGPEVYAKMFPDEETPDKTAGKKDKSSSFFPLDLAKELKKSVIGQDEAADTLCAAVYEHYLRCKSGRTGHKNNVLLLGPTGTGKTFLCHTLAKLLKVPFQTANITQYTEAGYVGFDIGDILFNLAKKAGPLVKNELPFSIVYIDEVDKLRINKDRVNYDKGIGVQQELLKMLESDEYTCLPHERLSAPKKFNIGKVLFVLGGAFVGLEDIIAKRLNKHCIGFGAGSSSKTEIKDFKNVTSEDLAEFGLMPEMIGRISNRIALNRLEEKDLMRILQYGKDSVLEDYIKLYQYAGIKLTVSAEELRKIAALAIKQGTGARGLAGIVSKPLSYTLLKASVRDIKEISFEDAQKIYYTAQYLGKIKECTAQTLPALFEKIYETEGLEVCAAVLKESMAAELDGTDEQKRGISFYFNALKFLFDKGLHPDGELMDIALTSADIILLKMCLSRGGNPNETVPVTGTGKSENCTWTLLHKACLPDIPAECMDILLKNGADVKQKSTNGFTPFMWACALGASTAKLELLLKAGSDTGETLPDGRTLLRVALDGICPDTLTFLFKHGVRLNLNNTYDSEIADMAQNGELKPELGEIILKFCGTKDKHKGTDKQ